VRRLVWSLPCDCPSSERMKWSCLSHWHWLQFLLVLGWLSATARAERVCRFISQMRSYSSPFLARSSCGGAAQRLQVSAAIGRFWGYRRPGMADTHRLLAPRDLFAATFLFLFWLQIDRQPYLRVACVLCVITAGLSLTVLGGATNRCDPCGRARRPWCRGEFSIVLQLGVGLEPQLGLSAGLVSF